MIDSINYSNNLSDELTLLVFRELDAPALASARYVNRRFFSLSFDKAFYTETELKTFNNYKISLRVYEEICDKISRIESKTVPREQLITDLKQKESSFFGKFVSIIRFESVFLKIITQLFCRFFPTIRKEIEEREEIESQISRCNPEKDDAMYGIYYPNELLELLSCTNSHPFDLRGPTQDFYQKYLRKWRLERDNVEEELKKINDGYHYTKAVDKENAIRDKEADAFWKNLSKEE